MRISELNERAEMSSVLYHGTSTTKAATAILKQGIRAQSDEKMGRKPRGALTPVQGHVYLTPSIHYAAIYALGGNYVGHDPMKSLKPSGRNRYGYIFVIDSKDISVVQPDEDEVGGACRDAPGIIKYWSENNKAPHTRHMDNLAFGQALCDDVSFCRQLDSFAKAHLTRLQYDKLVNGFYYDIMAVAGKKLLKVMPQHMKDKLVSMGCHVSTPDAVMPREVWKVDKQKSAELGFRAEHLFDIAEKIFPK